MSLLQEMTDDSEVSHHGCLTRDDSHMKEGKNALIHGRSIGRKCNMLVVHKVIEIQPLGCLQLKCVSWNVQQQQDILVPMSRTLGTSKR